MAYNFKLEIGGYFFPVQATIGKLSIEYNLHNLWFNRRVYQPGEIVAEISLRPKKTISQLTEMFLMKEVSLKNGDTVIAQNYYVHEVLPQEKKNDVSIFVKLVIYSMDKLMTLDKYSKVYAGLKLGSEILNKERLNFKFGETAVKVDFERMRMLKYMYSTTMNTDREQTGKKVVVKFASEFIHPYLVQYNESFYDFLSRTANRCGEFLYFEDGNLNLGLKTRIEKYKEKDENEIEIEKTRELDPILIEGYDSITYKSISSSKLAIDRYTRDTMKDKWGVMEKTNYDVAKKNAAGYPHDAFPRNMVYNTELTSDEFFFPLYADKFTTFEREMGGVGTDGEKAATQIFPILYDITANSADFIDCSFKVVADETKALIEAGISNAKKNSTGKKDYITFEQGKETAKMLEKGDGETCVVPFGSLSKEGWTTLDYYRDVRKYEEQLQRDIICIDMGTNYTDVKLGDKIKLSETGDPYVVIQILMVRGVDTDQTTQTPHVYTDYDGTDSPKMEKTQNQKIFAIPYLKTKEDEQEVYKPYPPVLNVPVVRKAEPQTAFVTASNDPKYQGRVRIVYPWQTDNCGVMVKLKQAEEEYEAAQKTYLEKKQKKEQLEKDLDVLKKEKLILDDNKVDKEKALKEIIDRLSELNKTLDASTEDDNLKNNVTEAELDEAQEKIAPLEAEVNKKEADVVKRQAELKSLKSEKAALDKELEELERKKEELEKENELLQLKYNVETGNNKTDLNTKIGDNKDKIDSLKKQISGADDKGGLKATIKTIQDKIDKLELEKLDGNDNEESILYAENLLEKEKEKLEAQREKYILLQQKKGIEDYFDELNESTKKEIINNQIEVKGKDGTLTGGKKKEVEDAKKDTEKAKKELEKKEEAVDKLAKELQKVVSAMASPWIRMTSPMATDGGGTIFKPRLGDEVLVNYECGNVERPYVVGSLFSKNVLEPDERINRQVGPNLHKGASIAIVSPNGHGITFKDPSSDAGFAASVYPGIGVLNNLIIDNVGVKWPKSKDLAGGIKIGDRYGLYSIDMSSDKRSVKISSSLGTVSLNAFTGITISAPNGDIKIEGKNVSIKAGNNLSLTSGANIETISKRKKKYNSGSELAGTLVGMSVTNFLKEVVLPWVDVSLVRTALEVVLRPVEGTTQIKSHRYMKLEAGSGNATIKHDRYTNKKHAGIDDSNKLKQTQELMHEIKKKIGDIKSTISVFCRVYHQKWTDGVTEKSDYIQNAQNDTYLITKDDPTIDSIISEAKNPLSVAPQTWTDWDKTNQSLFNGKLNGALGDPAKDTFFLYANDFGKAVFELTKHVMNFKEIYTNITLPAGSQLNDTINGALKDSLKDLADDFLNGWNNYHQKEKDNFLATDNDGFEYWNTTLLTRKWAALFLLKISDSYKDILKLYYEKKTLTDDMLIDNYKWGLFVKNLELMPMPQFFRTIVDALKKAGKDSFLPFANPLKDRLMWADKSSGQILLSDNPDYTINLANRQPGAVNQNIWQVEEDANKNTLDNVKSELLGLK